MGKLNGKKVAILATDGVEQVELTEPRKAFEDAGRGGRAALVEAGEFQGFNHLDKADTFTADKAVGDANAEDFDALLLPGRRRQPRLPAHRRRRGGRSSATSSQAGKPVGVICHGPWTLVEADVLKGRTITSWPSLQTDIRNAGGTWVDEEVVVDEGLVSSRKPDDLPAFSAKIVEEFCEGRHETPAAAGAPP